MPLRSRACTARLLNHAVNTDLRQMKLLNTLTSCGVRKKSQYNDVVIYQVRFLVTELCAVAAVRRQQSSCGRLVMRCGLT